ncbi:MAG TPA: hypothetical protein DEP43_05155 [Ruminococcaceae bacterium]|nr:hypothetical protein [Oscillospiraceae bacterium]
MKNKKTFFIIALVFVLLIGGATVLYRQLGKNIAAEQLATQSTNQSDEEIAITKTYTRLSGKDIISPPKTPKSERVVSIPAFLCDELRWYMGQLYGVGQGNRLFPFTKFFLEHEIVRGCKLSGVKKIRLHDIRHSHASLLIELGFSPLLIADRLGHEKVETTLNTYSHLWPHKQSEVAAKLQDLK